MQAFEFDQKFARFVPQVDSQAISRGTWLYESGHARVASISESRIEGSVTDGRNGVFAVALADNGQGGLSGNCDCDQFFNCAHSYALARATRDVLQRRPGPSADSSAPPSKRAFDAPGRDAARKDQPDTRAQMQERLGRPLSPRQTELQEAADQLWKLTRRANFRLFPRDLRPFTSDGHPPPLPPSEPLRELTRLLPRERKATPLDLVDAVKCFCQYKGIELDEDFKALADVSQPEQRLQRLEEKRAQDRWKDRPLRLTYRFRLASTEDRDWFSLAVEPVTDDPRLDADQIKQLLAAPNQMLQLPGIGWVKLDSEIDEPLASLARDFGVDPLRGNVQRLHALQAHQLIPKENRAEDEAWERAAARSKALQRLPVPQPPSPLQAILRPYQQEGFQFLCQLSQRGCGGLLADDMGLGKTLQSLAWLMWLRTESRQPLRALIVCPKSVMNNWLQEPSKFKTGLRAELFAPGAADKPAPTEANLLVANYAQLRLRADFFLGQAWTAVILDEGQYIKNPSSQTAQVAYKLKAKHRIALTGTPIENSLQDLWSLMRFAMPRLLGPQAAFALNYDASSDPQALSRLNRRIRPFYLRRLKSEVAKDLPERIEEELHCQLEEEQAALYAAELQAARDALSRCRQAGSSSQERFNVLQSLLRLRQVCCDPQLLGHPLPDDAPSAKTQALLDLVQPIVEEGHKVLVFSQFVSMLEILKIRLDQAGLPSLMLTGQTRQREALIERFQQPDGEPIFLLSLKAAGSGLNLTAASYVILYDPWWNPAVEAQAIDRAHRIGQASQVIAYRLLANNTVEEKIRRIQSEKSELAQAVFGEDASTSRPLDLDTLEQALLAD